MLAFSLESVRHQHEQRLAPVAVFVLIVFAAGYLGVIVHEGAHVLTGWTVGRKVSGVKLNRDATGETSYAEPGAILPRIMSGFAGYLGPSLFGLGAAKLIALGHIKAVLALALLFLVVMLCLVRNFFGGLPVIANGAVMVLVLGYGSARLQAIAAHGLSWLLLLFGVGSVLTHWTNAGDADTLHKITHIPPVVWATLWLAGTLAALLAGAHLLA